MYVYIIPSPEQEISSRLSSLNIYVFFLDFRLEINLIK